MTDILAGLGIQAAKKWVLPAVLGGLAGVALTAIVVGVPAYFMVSGARETAAAAESALASMTRERDVAANDARRWESFGNTAAAAVTTRNAEIEAQRADLIATEMLLEQANEAADREAADLKARIRTLKEKADANPDQVRALGPLARDAAKLLQSR